MKDSCSGINVIPIQTNINCLFLAVSQHVYNADDGYSEVRFSAVYKIINEWEYYKDFIVDLSTVNSAEDCKNLLC